MSIMSRRTYYRVGEIDAEHCHRYTADEAVELAANDGTPGPWHAYDGDERAYWTDDDGEPWSGPTRSTTQATQEQA